MIRTTRNFTISYPQPAHERGKKARGRVREAWQIGRCLLTASGMCKARCPGKCACSNPRVFATLLQVRP